MGLFLCLVLLCPRVNRSASLYFLFCVRRNYLVIIRHKAKINFSSTVVWEGHSLWSLLFNWLSPVMGVSAVGSSVVMGTQCPITPDGAVRDTSSGGRENKIPGGGVS